MRTIDCSPPLRGVVLVQDSLVGGLTLTSARQLRKREPRWKPCSIRQSEKETLAQYVVSWEDGRQIQIGPDAPLSKSGRTSSLTQAANR